MTSKNSFLISMRENMRRRMWYPLLLLLIQIFEYPVAVTMVLSNNKINDLRDAGRGNQWFPDLFSPERFDGSFYGACYSGNFFRSTGSNAGIFLSE